MHTLNKRTKQHPLRVPMICLALSLLALIVSIVNLFNAASYANRQTAEFLSSWQGLQSELFSNSLQQLQNSVAWSLGLAGLCLITFCWLVLVARKMINVQTCAHTSEGFSERAALAKLTEEIAPLANGDLRITATVSDTAVGSLAEAFNQIVGELRRLVELLDSSSERINESVDGAFNSAQSINSACAEQSRQIHLSSNFLFSMSAATSDLSADAAESTVAAQTAVHKAEACAQALGACLRTLSAIHDEADNTTRLMHRLADNVAAIDESVTRIQEVAKQTDLLALNTTIRASAGSRQSSTSDAAADLGRLSDEVAQLAEVLGQSTRDIGSLTRIISQNASETGLSMEHITAELESGVSQTQHANYALLVIQDRSRALHERVLGMAERSVEQSGIARQLTENMDQLNQITDEVTQGVVVNTSSLAQLQEISGELRKHKEKFQLPSTHSALSGRQKTTGAARRAADRVVNA